MLHTYKRKILAVVPMMALWCSTLALSEPLEKKLDVEIDVSTVDAVIVNVPAGELNISETTGQTIEAEAVVTCNKRNDTECRNRIFEEIKWSANEDGGPARLNLTPPEADQYDDISVIVNVGIPQHKTLTVNLDYGDLRLKGTNACLDVNVKAGNLQLDLKEKSLASANLIATIGDVRLTTPAGTIPGKRSKIVGAKLAWNEGIGACHVQAKVRAGNIELNLK